MLPIVGAGVADSDELTVERVPIVVAFLKNVGLDGYGSLLHGDMLLPD